MAPRLRGGRLLLNCARTTPEFPDTESSVSIDGMYCQRVHTMCPCDLTPDDSDLCASNFFATLVDVCDALAQIEVCSLRVVYVLDLDERCVWVLCSLAALERDMLAPAIRSVLGLFY